MVRLEQTWSQVEGSAQSGTCTFAPTVFALTSDPRSCPSFLSVKVAQEEKKNSELTRRKDSSSVRSAT